MRTVAYYKGCLASLSAKELDTSTQALAPKVGLELIELEAVTCCGAGDIHEAEPDYYLHLNARILAYAEDTGVDSILTAYGDQFDGKIVVDITNPLNFDTFDSLTVPVGSSAAAEIQARLPESTVVKAFNTTFAGTLVGKQVGNQSTTVLIAGDDTSAKQTLAAAIEAGGISTIDAGSLSRAHELEALGFLQLTLAAGEQISWTGGFAVTR